MTREEKLDELEQLEYRYARRGDIAYESRLKRLYRKRKLLSGRKLNNLLKRYRILKVFAEAV